MKQMVNQINFINMRKLVLVLFVITFMSCSSQDENLFQEDIPVTLSATTSSPDIPSQYLDWENTQFVYYNKDFILFPWESGANSSMIPKEIRDDYTSADGWVLLYNDFYNDEPDPKFILYNKFRGIVKVFVYVTQSIYTGKDLIWGFGVNTADENISSFNFTKNIAKPLNEKESNPAIYVINYNNVSHSFYNSITQGKWYSNQFEVMYDPTLENRENIDFCFQSFAIDKIDTQLNIDNDKIGSYAFTLPSQNNTTSLFYDLRTCLKNNSNVKLDFQCLTEATPYLTSYISAQTNLDLKHSLSEGFSSINTSGLSDNPMIEALTNTTSVNESNNETKLNCSLKATIVKTNNVTTPFVGPHATFKYPGTSNTASEKHLPNYDKPLGVFCITNQPKVELTQDAQWNNVTGSYSVVNHFKLDPTSFSVIINEEVKTACSDIKVNKQIVYNPGYKHYLIETKGGANLIDSYEGNIRYLSNNEDFREVYQGTEITNITANQCKIRITITMTPKGQDKQVIIVKEFDPSLSINKNIDYVYGNSRIEHSTTITPRK